CMAHTPVSMLGKIFSTIALPRKSDRCFSDRSPVTRVASGALFPGRGSSPFSFTGLPFSVTVAMGGSLQVDEWQASSLRALVNGINPASSGGGQDAVRGRRRVTAYCRRNKAILPAAQAGTFP